MKAICLLMAGCVLVQMQTAQAQDKPGATTNISGETVNAFGKGHWLIDMQQYFGFSASNNYSNDIKTSETSRWSFNLGADYMFGRNMGAGLELSYRNNRRENGTELKSSDLMFWANFIYALPLGGRTHIYFKPAVGYGVEKETQTNTTGGSFEQDWSTLGFRFTTGVPIPINNGPVFVNPFLSYKRLCVDYEDGEESINRFSFGVNFFASIPPSGLMCDKEVGYRQANSRYDQGSSYVSYYTKGRYMFGDSKAEYNNFPDPVESEFSEGHVRFDLAYYPLNNFYIGSEFRWGSDVSRPGNQPNYEYTNSEFMFIPKIGLNLPVRAPWNNFYVEAAAGWGSEKLKIDDNGNVNEFKDKTFYYGATLGHNWFFTDQVALTSQLRYTMYSSESTTSTTAPELENKGWGLRLGARFFLEKF